MLSNYYVKAYHCLLLTLLRFTEIVAPIKNYVGPWPVWLGSLEERHPVDQKIAGLITSQGTYPGCRFHPHVGCVQVGSDQYSSLTSIFLSLSLHSSISKSNEKNVLR